MARDGRSTRPRCTTSWPGPTRPTWSSSRPTPKRSAPSAAAVAAAAAAFTGGASVAGGVASGAAAVPGAAAASAAASGGGGSNGDNSDSLKESLASVFAGITNSDKWAEAFSLLQKVICDDVQKIADLSLASMQASSNNVTTLVEKVDTLQERCDELVGKVDGIVTNMTALVGRVECLENKEKDGSLREGDVQWRPANWEALKQELVTTLTGAVSSEIQKYYPEDEESEESEEELFCFCKSCVSICKNAFSFCKNSFAKLALHFQELFTFAKMDLLQKSLYICKNPFARTLLHFARTTLHEHICNSQDRFCICILQQLFCKKGFAFARILLPFARTLLQKWLWLLQFTR